MFFLKYFHHRLVGLTHSVRIRRLMKKLPLTMGILAASLGPCKWHVQLPVVVEVSYLHMQTRSTRAHTHTPLHIGPYWQCPFIFTSTMYSVSLPVLGSFCALGLEPSPEQRCWYGAMFDDTECLFMCGLVYPILWKISMCPLLSFVLDCLLLWPRGFLCMVCVLAFP